MSLWKTIIIGFIQFNIYILGLTYFEYFGIINNTYINTGSYLCIIITLIDFIWIAKSME